MQQLMKHLNFQYITIDEVVSFNQLWNLSSMIVKVKKKTSLITKQTKNESISEYFRTDPKKYVSRSRFFQSLTKFANHVHCIIILSIATLYPKSVFCAQQFAKKRTHQEQVRMFILRIDIHDVVMIGFTTVLFTKSFLFCLF